MAKRVLAIDDSPVVLRLHADLLGRAGYQVVVAPNAREGLFKLKDFTPDLILLDIRMPGMSGWEFLDRVRERERLQDVPVIVFSGLPESSPQAQKMADKYSCYVTKKASGTELLRLMEEVLGEADVTDDQTGGGG
ncbi:MAG: response regulator [Armatimonadota bacterium]|nr:response regulator [Armatimonadota bacterium]